MWYFVDKNGQKQGPVSPEDIQSLIDADSITPNTLVWKSGMNSWSVMTDTELKELFPIRYLTSKQ